MLSRVLVVCIVFNACPVYSQPASEAPSFTYLKKGEPLLSLDSAWCYSDKANAILITSAERAEKRCQLEAELQFTKDKAKHDLEVGLLRAHIKSIESSHSRVEAALKVENENLTKVALDRPTDMRMWFAAGGFAVGIATTLLIGWLTVSAQAGFQ